jgi:GR25 family glycosyltransferase involved in LPS biosynthesis
MNYNYIEKKYIEGFEEEEKKGLNKCDGIVYINLENREDRKKLFIEEIEKIGIDKNKVHKVSGVYIPKNGHKGCIQSHILALRIAQMNNWNTTCIMEDDAELTVSPDEFNNKIDEIYKELNDKNINWDVIMLSTANKAIVDNNPNYNTLDKIKFATLGTCYIVKNKYIPKLLSLFEHCQSMMSNDKWGDDDGHEPYALDQKWGELMKQDNWYTSKNNFIKQRNIKSTTNSKGN